MEGMYICLQHVIRVQYEEAAIRENVLCIIHQGQPILYISKPICLMLHHESAYGAKLSKSSMRNILKTCLQKKKKSEHENF